MEDDYEDPAPYIPPSPTARPAARPAPSPTAMDRFLDLGTTIRYGVPASEKFRMMAQGEIPGAPNNDPLNPDTERYASNYLGAKKYGALPASLFNAIALGDIGDMVMGVPGVGARKAAGIEGALRADPGSSFAGILRRIQAGLR